MDLHNGIRGLNFANYVHFRQRSHCCSTFHLPHPCISLLVFLSFRGLDLAVFGDIQHPIILQHPFDQTWEEIKFDII